MFRIFLTQPNLLIDSFLAFAHDMTKNKHSRPLVYTNMLIHMLYDKKFLKHDLKTFSIFVFFRNENLNNDSKSRYEYLYTLYTYIILYSNSL